MQKNRVTLPGLACLVLAVIGYIMIYKPLISDIEATKMDLEMVELEYSTKQKRIDTAVASEQEIKNLIKKTASQFYGEIPQEEIIVKINDLCTAAELRVLKISYSGLSEFELEPEKTDEDGSESEESKADMTAEESETDTTAEEPETDTTASQESESESTREEEPDKTVFYGDVFTVKFAGTFEQILAVLNSIDNNDKKIVNQGMEINKELDTTSEVPEELPSMYPDVDFEGLILEEQVLSCQIELIFFHLEEMEEYVIDDYNILEAEPREKSSLESPFDVYADESLIP